MKPPLDRILEKEHVVVLPPADVLITLRMLRRAHIRAAACVLDPPYNVGHGGTRKDYLPWLLRVIRAAAQVADHVFVWGLPEMAALILPRIPTSLRLKAWITWVYRNAPTHVRGWRPAQQTCLHLAHPKAKMHPENFFTPTQVDAHRAGKLRYPPSPPSVIDAALLVGWCGKDEQTGHPAQKPEKAIEPLVLMSTAPGDLILDPMAGSGTTGTVAKRLGRRSILCDHDEENVARIEKRLGISRTQSVTQTKRQRIDAVTSGEAADRRVRTVRLVVNDGLSQAEAARRVGTSRESVRRWVDTFHELGLEGLKPRLHQGRAPSLSDAQRMKIQRLLKRGKLAGTNHELVTEILRLTGVRFHPGHVRRLLAKIAEGLPKPP